ncbi:ATP-binding protein [Paraclostridium bifermentans]|uniref:ATP-binding protein n=1 Tax=Paraclostridium bifermentans TaxID=1490 RepID=A0AA44IH32_PARBF|nr:AAA family ATPase [Paraclostridium bifermentans]NME09472.1 ATP-binding protein [Paraclostridium bifermentans]
MDKLNKIIVNNYKSYNQLEIDMNHNINVLIGRNNSGKSSIIDVLNICNDIHLLENAIYNRTKLDLEINLEEQDLVVAFNKMSSEGSIGRERWEYAENFIGKNILVELNIERSFSDRSIKFNNVLSKSNDFYSEEVGISGSWNRLCKNIKNPINERKIIKLAAERDIYIEEDCEDSIDCDVNGRGATNMIHKFINSSSLDSKKVEVELLNALNLIMWPDSEFTDIVVQQVKENNKIFWEIFLEENNIRIPLSKCGSGLKTIILVLIKLLLVPTIRRINESKIIYAFEELENNLHPHLQRNLFNFIIDWVEEKGSTLFITTHSNVAINIFANLESAQLIHVSKQNGISKANSIDISKNHILNDLGNLASDILQSNGIIWVEGPSDRMYINKWIEIISEGQLKEHIHYQIMFYGGRLLSHLSLADRDDENCENDDLINLMLMNRNSIVVIDSDKRNPDKEINATKKRLKEECKKYDSICWITEGKEIENYVPKSVIDEVFSLESNTEFGKYMTIIDYINSISLGDGTKFEKNKVKYANDFLNLINIDNMGVYDLINRVTEIVGKIKEWNNIK